MTVGAHTERGGCISFLRSAVLCSVDIHLDKLQGEQRRADMLNFPFPSLVPADHASCFSKSFPDTDDLLLSILVITLLLSCVSQHKCPCVPRIPSLCSSPISWPPQVIPLCPGWVCPPTPFCLRDVRWGHESLHYPPQLKLLLECLCTQHTLASCISQTCAQGSANHTPQQEVPLGRSQGGLC